MTIISSKNSKIQRLIKLIKKSKERIKKKCFVVEGIRENEIAIKKKFNIIEFYICPTIYKFKLSKKYIINNVNQLVYKKIAYRDTTEGIIGLYKIFSLNHNNINIKLSNNPTVVIVESIEKPGNLGAILRICDIFLINLLIICNSKIDIFNPNLIRSSLGAVFTVPIVKMNNIECLNFCLKNKLKIYTTFIEDKNQMTISSTKINFNVPIAIIFGSEDKGISSFWKKHSNKNYNIPMLGVINSFNVSSSVAIILYQILYQKKMI